MAGMDGIEVARHLKKLDPAPGVSFTTACDRHALEAFEASALKKRKDGRYRLRFAGLEDSVEVSRRCLSQVRRLLKGVS